MYKQLKFVFKNYF